jgi:hypothetical protein
MNNNLPPGIPFTVEEVPIPFGERLTAAIQQFFYLLMMGPVCIVLAPVHFFRILFTKTRATVVITNTDLTKGKLPMDNMGGGNDDEPWKKQHREMYGDDE